MDFLARNLALTESISVKLTINRKIVLNLSWSLVLHNWPYGEKTR